MFWTIVGALFFFSFILPLIIIIVSMIFLGSTKWIFDSIEKITDRFRLKKKVNNSPIENPYNNIFKDLQNKINQIDQKTES